MRYLTPFNLIDNMDSLFNSALSPRSARFFDENNFAPPCDIEETDDHYLMNVELPGLKKEDVNIEFKDNVLTISGEKRREWTEGDDKKSQRVERSYGFFKRSFALPATLETDKIEAQFNEGVLQLYLPKAQVAKAKKIEVKPGSSGFFDKLIGSKKQ